MIDFWFKLVVLKSLWILLRDKDAEDTRTEIEKLHKEIKDIHKDFER